MFDMKKLLLIDALKFIPKCYKFMKGRTGSTLSSTKYVKCFSVETSCYVPLLSTSTLKGRDHGYAHARHLSLQNKFVGSTLNSKSPLPVQSPGSAVNLNNLNFIEIELFIKMLYEVWSSLQPEKNSYIFSLPRISTKD